MKKSLLIAAALAGVSLVGSASAFTPKDSAKRIAELGARPIPAKVVSPTDLPRSFEGAVVNVEFTVDAEGQPQDIRVYANDAVVKRQMLRAFSQWRFASSGPEQIAAGKRFVLPVQINAEG